MRDHRPRLLRALLAAATLGTLAVATGQAAGETSGFVEPVRVLQTFHGDSPGAQFGWAVSELGDVDGDGAMEAIVGEPFRGPTGATGRVDVYSARTGALLHRFEGRGTDLAGWAIADAGDTTGDGVPEIVVGAPGRGAGHVYLYSGSTGRRLTTFEGGRRGDFFGSAVSSAGDVDGDGRADLLVGASNVTGGVPGAGRAYVYSGRTYRLIRTLHAGQGPDQFGSGTDWTPDVDGDGVPDQIVGANDAGGETAGTGKGKAYVFSGRTGALLYGIPAPPSGRQLGFFFVAGVGDTNGDGVPDVYAADYADASHGRGTGRAAVYSGVDGSLLHAFVGASAGQGTGPGREAGDVDGDGLVDLAVGSYTSPDGAPNAGKIEIYSGADGSLLRRITSTTENEQLGFDAVGLGDVDGDGAPDLLASAANGETVYVIAGGTP